MCGEKVLRSRKRKRRKVRCFLCLIAAAFGIGGMLLTLAAKSMEICEAAAAETETPWNTTLPATVSTASTASAVPADEPAAQDQDPVGRDPDIPLIAVDGGQEEEDEGCFEAADKNREKDLETADLLRGKLEELGYQVTMSPEDAGQAELSLKIYQNTWEVLEVNGIETWYGGRDVHGDRDRLTRLFRQEAAKITEEKEPLSEEEYRERIAMGMARAVDLYFHPKTMYLTFDDGPSEENTGAVLDVLKARGLKATFFVVGENVRRHPETARRIVAEGHTIGIHCNRHEYGELYQSVDSYMKDFEEAYAAVKEVTGVEPQLFRFPGGSINAYNQQVGPEIIREMENRGFIYYDWNASLEDAIGKRLPEELIKNGRETTLGRRRVVLLAHDIVHSTALCLDDLIDRLPEYRMEPLTIETSPIQFTP